MILRIVIVVALLAFAVEVVGMPPVPTLAAVVIGSVLGWAADVGRRRYRANGVRSSEQPGEGDA